MTNEGRGPIRNAGFNLFEVDSGAQWMKDAHKLNYQHGIKTNMVSMDGQGQSASNASNDGQEIDVIAKCGQKYKWSQTSDSVEIVLALPTDTTVPPLTSKLLTVKITTNQVIVTIKSSAVEILNVVLSNSINTSDSTWLIANNQLEVTLAKRDENTSWATLEK